MLALLLLWHLHRGRRAAGVFLALLIARYFFDGIFSLMSRGWAFTVLGAAFLGLGVLLDQGLRRRRRDGGEQET